MICGLSEHQINHPHQQEKPHGLEMAKALGDTELWVCQWMNDPQNTNPEIPNQTKHVKNPRGETLA